MFNPSSLRSQCKFDVNINRVQLPDVSPSRKRFPRYQHVSGLAFAAIILNLISSRVSHTSVCCGSGRCRPSKNRWCLKGEEICSFIRQRLLLMTPGPRCLQPLYIATYLRRVVSNLLSPIRRGAEPLASPARKMSKNCAFS